MHYYMLAALLNAALAAGQRNAMFAGHRLQQWRQTGDRPNYLQMLTGGGVLPRRVWSRQDDGQPTATGRRRRRFPTSKAMPVMGHWRALHEKLEVQSMWPGTEKYANELYLPATTVSTYYNAYRDRYDICLHVIQ